MLVQTITLTARLLVLCFLLTACFSRSTNTKGSGAAKQTARDLPNIVFILADDMGYGDVQRYNAASKIPTPALNRLAAEGLLFTDAHAPGSWCIPSRFGLITGQYPLRKAMDLKKGGLISPDQITLASLLKRNGYYTAMVGKWHLGFHGVSDWDKVDYSKPFKGGPVDSGFDYFFGMHASLDIPPYFFIDNKQAVNAPTNTIDDHQSPDATTTISGAFWRAGKIAPGFDHEEVLPIFQKKVVSFLENHVQEKKQQPFFLYLALTAPHTPWMPQKQFRGKSQAGEYGDFTMQVDHTVGEVLQALDKLGLKENTLVIFTSDNGPVWFKEDVQKYNHQATGNFRGIKIDAYEGAHRLPFIVRWPGKIKANTTTDALLSFTDMLATFAAIAGDTLSKGQSQDSNNMMPVLLGKKESPRSGLIVEGHTVREGDWKLIFGNGTGGLHQHFGNIPAPAIEGELYNLKEDPFEKENLFTLNPEKVAALKKRMEQYRAEGTAANASTLKK